MKKITFEGIENGLEQEARKFIDMGVPHIFLYKENEETSKWKVIEHGDGFDIVTAFAMAISSFSRYSGYKTDDIIQAVREVINAIE